MGVIAATLAYAVLAFWLPGPNGWIAAMLVMYAGGTCTVLVVGDLSRLREEQRKWRRLVWVPVADTDLRLVLDVADLAQEHVRRWRAWRPWLISGWLLAGTLWLVFGPSFGGVVAFALAIVVLLRDAWLGVQATEGMPSTVRAGLRGFERAWLDLYRAMLGILFLAAGLGAIGLVAYRFVGPVPITWAIVTQVELIFLWASFGVAASAFGWMRLRSALRHRARDDAPEWLELDRRGTDVDSESLSPRD